MKTGTKHILFITESVWQRLVAAREAYLLTHDDKPVLHVQLDQWKLARYMDGTPFRTYGVTFGGIDAK